MPEIIEEEEEILQPHMTNKRLNEKQYAEQDIITIKTISPEEETHCPIIIPNDKRQTGIKHTSRKIIHQLVNEKTEKDVRIAALKKTIQYQIDEELQWQHIKTSTNIPQNTAHTIFEDGMPPIQAIM